MAVTCRFDEEKECGRTKTSQYDGKTKHLPPYSLCACCLILEGRKD